MLNATRSKKSVDIKIRLQCRNTSYLLQGSPLASHVKKNDMSLYMYSSNLLSPISILCIGIPSQLENQSWFLIMQFTYVCTYRIRINKIVPRANPNPRFSTPYRDFPTLKLRVLRVLSVSWVEIRSLFSFYSFLFGVFILLSIARCYPQQFDLACLALWGTAHREY